MGFLPSSLADGAGGASSSSRHDTTDTPCVSNRLATATTVQHHLQDDAENESRTWKPDPEVTTCASMNSFDDSVLPDLPEACCFEVAGKIARLCYTFHICTPISSSASRRYLRDMTSPNICLQFMRRCGKDPGRHRKHAVVSRWDNKQVVDAHFTSVRGVPSVLEGTRRTNHECDFPEFFAKCAPLGCAHTARRCRIIAPDAALLACHRHALSLVLAWHIS